MKQLVGWIMSFCIAFLGVSFIVFLASNPKMLGVVVGLGIFAFIVVMIKKVFFEGLLK